MEISVNCHDASSHLPTVYLSLLGINPVLWFRILSPRQKGVFPPSPSQPTKGFCCLCEEGALALQNVAQLQFCNATRGAKPCQQHLFE